MLYLIKQKCQIIYYPDDVSTGQVTCEEKQFNIVKPIDTMCITEDEYEESDISIDEISRLII